MTDGFDSAYRSSELTYTQPKFDGATTAELVKITTFFEHTRRDNETFFAMLMPVGAPKPAVLDLDADHKTRLLQVLAASQWARASCSPSSLIMISDCYRADGRNTNLADVQGMSLAEVPTAIESMLLVVAVKDTTSSRGARTYEATRAYGYDDNGVFRWLESAMAWREVNEPFHAAESLALGVTDELPALPVPMELLTIEALADFGIYIIER